MSSRTGWAIADLEFAWVDPRPVQPIEQARVLDTYVRRGIYTVNEARDILGFGPIAGGERARVHGNAGPVPLAEPKPVGTAGPQ